MKDPVMAVVCGIDGCQHQVRVRGECGDRRCPRTSAAAVAVQAGTHAALAAQATRDAYGWPRPGAVTNILWHPKDEDRPPARRHWGPYRYDATLPPQIADADLLLPSGTAALLERAASDIRALNERVDIDPDALAAPLLRSESVASSRIEGLNASHLQVAQVLAGLGDGSAAAREIVNNVAATQAAIDIAADRTQALDVDAIQRIHYRLLVGTRDEDYAGKPRTEGASWIGGGSPRDAIYVPPPGDHVAPLLGDLAAFLQRDDLPVIAHAAIVHAQFEGIHPFPDGNGRAGRALVHALYRRSGISPRYTVPVSAILLTDRDRYFNALAAYQQGGDPIPIINEFAEASITAAAEATNLSAVLAELRHTWLDDLAPTRAGTLPERIAEELIRYPIVDAASVADRHQTDPNVARRALDRLEEARILRPLKTQARNRVWVADDVIDALDRFAATVAREGPTGNRVAPSRHLRHLTTG